jgi:hypothetical protein
MPSICRSCSPASSCSPSPAGLLSESWRRQVISYGNVAASKWTVINEFETCLPTRPFCAEWQALQRRDYRSFTTNETVIPVAFVALYGVAIVAGVLLLVILGERGREQKEEPKPP